MEPFLEVGDAPQDLCSLVTLIGQRHDDVVIDLRQCVPMAKLSEALPIGIEDFLINRREFPF
jgi:hypothetical protein